MFNQSLLWNPPSSELVLSSNDIHVWCACLEQPATQIQQFTQILSEDERIRADRFYFERDRKHFIVGRGLLRTLLGRYLALKPHQIRFCYSPRGKPALDTASHDSTVEFNLSHSHELVLYAVTCDRQIGIDIEYIRPTSDIEQLAQRFFSPREYAVIHSLPPNQKQLAFFNGWTGKEAYLKAIGGGLAQLQQVEVSLNPGEPRRLLSINQDSIAASHWCLEPLNPAADYAATLAIEGHDWHLSCWQWSTES